jgi:hypothetical protein
MTRLILPDGQSQESVNFKKKLPVAVYFYSMGEKVDAIFSMTRDFQRIAPEPFVLVAPTRPKKMWWFIDSETEWGWIQGNFQQPVVQLYCRWLESLTSLPGVNPKRIGLFGWSAGAYAVTELLAEGCIPLSGVGLGAVHGHGQNDPAGLRSDLQGPAVEKFEAYLERLMAHAGVPWISATHGNTDQESKFADAQEIFRVLTEVQECLGLPAVTVRELEPEEQDVKPKAKKNRTHHNYFNTSFLRKEFFIALFGGPAPKLELKRKREAEEEEDHLPSAFTTWTKGGVIKPVGMAKSGNSWETPSEGESADDWGESDPWTMMMSMMKMMSGADPSSVQRKQPKGPPGCKVWIGNIAAAITWKELQKHMNQAGKTTWCEVFTKKGKSTGTVAYGSADEAAAAISALNGTELGGQAIECDTFW